MIFRDIGQPLTVVAVDRMRGEATVQMPDGKIRVMAISMLRATGGIGEISTVLHRLEAQQRRESQSTK